MAEKKKKTPECCKGCAKWDAFGDKCWVYWEGKKHCSMHSEKD